VRISRTISGSKRNTSSYKQEMARSKEMLEKVLKERKDQEIKYILSVVKLKAQGKDLTVVKLKKLLNDAQLKDSVILRKMRLINFYLNSLLPDEAKRFIDKFQRN